MATIPTPLAPHAAFAAAGAIGYDTIRFTSTHDQSEQPARFYPSPHPGPRPLLVLLHTWSTDIASYNPDAWVAVARERGWHVALPHARGANKNPEACASPASRQDVLDTIPAAQTAANTDPTRVYLAGVSGGGHMAMAMAAYHPKAFVAISAWVGISDLAAWHAETRSAGLHYWKDIEACTGGPPGASAAVDVQYHLRSPVHHLAHAAGVPLDLNAGIHDGHTGSVPIHHTLDAFNAVAMANGDPGITQSRINALSQEWAPPEAPVDDPAYARRIHLRAESGKARATIFEGGHEGLPGTACAWLAAHSRKPE